jgi:hypothetical protein
MTTPRIALVPVTLLALGLAGCSKSTAPITSPAKYAIEPKYENEPLKPKHSHFSRSKINPYFPLTPGTLYVYEGEKDGAETIDRTYISDQTKIILGVKCTVVLDSAFVDGELEEATIDWYAPDEEGNIVYYGEDTKEFENGQVVSTQGSWQAGVDGAVQGIIMEADPAVGDSYYQEFYKGEAEDHAEVTGLGGSVEVPFGKFKHCLVTKETSRLDPGAEQDKYYARGIGLLMGVTVEGGDEFMELVSISRPGDEGEVAERHEHDRGRKH